MTSFLPSPFSSQILPSTPHCSFSDPWPLFHSLLLHVCLYVHTHSLYIVTSLCVFRVDHLVLNNQLFSSWDKTISPTLSTSQLSPVLCRMEASEAFAAPAFGCPLGSSSHLPPTLGCHMGSSLFSCCSGSHVGETSMDVPSDITQRHTF